MRKRTAAEKRDAHARNRRRLLRLGEAADRLGVCRGMLYKLAKQGKLTMIKIGRASRIDEAEVERCAGSFPEARLTAIDRAA